MSSEYHDCKLLIALIAGEDFRVTGSATTHYKHHRSSDEQAPRDYGKTPALSAVYEFLTIVGFELLVSCSNFVTRCTRGDIDVIFASDCRYVGGILCCSSVAS